MAPNAKRTAVFALRGHPSDVSKIVFEDTVAFFLPLLTLLSYTSFFHSQSCAAPSLRRTLRTKRAEHAWHTRKSSSAGICQGGKRSRRPHEKNGIAPVRRGSNCALSTFEDHLAFRRHVTRPLYPLLNAVKQTRKQTESWRGNQHFFQERKDHLSIDGARGQERCHARSPPRLIPPLPNC